MTRDTSGGYVAVFEFVSVSESGITVSVVTNCKLLGSFGIFVVGGDKLGSMDGAFTSTDSKIGVFKLANWGFTVKSSSSAGSTCST